MLHFRPIVLSDKPAIDACLAGNTYRACDFCFTNFFAWQAKFKTTFAIEQETLFIRYADTAGELCYMLPVGKLTVEQSLPLVLHDARTNGIPFTLKGITERMLEKVNEAFPDLFIATHDRDNDEYIYLSEKLIQLTGKHLQSKRNHINRFRNDHPDWEYLPLDNQHIREECCTMLDLWEELNLSKAEQSLRYDYIATRIMLEQFEALGLRGGAIRASGKLAAFSIGEPLTPDTFVVHVEKAYADMNGAYAIINQQFALHEARPFLYINREEDMGLEHLRRAKQSYYPDLLLHEHILTLKEH